jgi:hypothetical protein
MLYKLFMAALNIIYLTVSKTNLYGTRSFVENGKHSSKMIFTNYIKQVSTKFDTSATGKNTPCMPLLMRCLAKAFRVNYTSFVFLS